jgi:hypothetical protein
MIPIESASLAMMKLNSPTWDIAPPSSSADRSGSPNR